MPEESRDGTRDGAFLYFYLPLPQHEAVLKTQGHFQVVFSLREFLATKRNILFAAGLSALVLSVLVVVLVQLHRVQDWLRATQQQKSRMISTISHDTNHYLTVIRLKLENLLVRARQTKPIEDLEGQLVMAKDNTESLAQLLDNLSTYERITETTFVLEPLELTALLEYECRSLEDTAGRRGQKVQYAWSVSPCTVLADRMQLRRVVQNLLRNAMKFSPEASNLRCVLSADAAQVRVRISDEGCGIPAEAWERVFQPYVRLQNTIKGTGLGLAIARELMRKMHGELTIVDSVPGAGTTFELTMPHAAAAAEVVNNK
jgi:signal transduction histidine kinase